MRAAVCCCRGDPVSVTSRPPAASSSRKTDRDLIGENCWEHALVLLRSLRGKAKVVHSFDGFGRMFGPLCTYRPVKPQWAPRPPIGRRGPGFMLLAVRFPGRVKNQQDAQLPLVSDRERSGPRCQGLAALSMRGVAPPGTRPDLPPGRPSVRGPVTSHCASRGGILEPLRRGCWPPRGRFGQCGCWAAVLVPHWGTQGLACLHQ